MIVISNDHAGMKLKKSFINYFRENNIKFVDCGSNILESKDSFVDFGKSAVEYYVEKCDTQKDRLILICGSGIGMSILANRNPAIRAVLAFDKVQAGQGRRHNDCNCLCLGERYTSFDKALEIFNIFMDTKFMGGKYLERMEDIDKD